MTRHSAPLAVSASLAVLLASLLAAPLAHAEIYTWKDKDGRVHYSDKPPSTGEVKTIGPARRPQAVVEEAPAEGEAPAPAANPPAAAPAEPTLAERELEFRQRRAAEAEAQAKAEEESRRQAERQRACEQARGQLAALQSGQRIARFNLQGEREFISDAERAAETQRVQSFIDSECQ